METKYILETICVVSGKTINEYRERGNTDKDKLSLQKDGKGVIIQ